MAVDDRGERNRPIYAGVGAPADAEDLTYLGELATMLGTRRAGTAAQRQALSSEWLWEGLDWFETDTGITWRVDASGLWTIAAYVSGLLDLPSRNGNFQTADGAGWRIDGTRRELEGQLSKVVNNTATNIASGDRMFTFAAADRPKWPRYFTGVGAGGSTMRVKVDSVSGVVSVDTTPTIATTYVRFDGIFWRVGS